MSDSLTSARTLKGRILTAHNNAMTALAVADRPADPIEAWEKQMDADLDALVDQVDRLEAELERALGELSRLRRALI